MEAVGFKSSKSTSLFSNVNYPFKAICFFKCQPCVPYVEELEFRARTAYRARELDDALDLLSRQGYYTTRRLCDWSRHIEIQRMCRVRWYKQYNGIVYIFYIMTE